MLDHLVKEIRFHFLNHWVKATKYQTPTPCKELFKLKMGFPGNLEILTTSVHAQAGKVGMVSGPYHSLSHGPLSQLVPKLPTNLVSPGFCTWEYWGLFQLTGTRTLELEPDEVEDVLRVTAMALGFPSRPVEFCSSSYRLPMIGVLERTQSTHSSITLKLLWCVEFLYPAATKDCLFD